MNGATIYNYLYFRQKHCDKSHILLTINTQPNNYSSFPLKENNQQSHHAEKTQHPFQIK